MRRSKLCAHDLQAVVLPSTDIRPPKKVIASAELDGTRGLFRRPQTQCMLQAINDYQAILAWLRSRHGLTPDQKAQLRARRPQRDVMGNHGVEQGIDWLQALPTTLRAYRIEAERFLLRAVTHKGNALCLMSHKECIEYSDFLADSQPRSR